MTAQVRLHWKCLMICFCRALQLNQMPINQHGSCQRQLLAGLRSRSRYWSWSRSESTVLPGVGFRVGVGKILPTPTLARCRRVPPVDRRRFRTNGYASSRKLWRTEKNGEWQYGDKLKRHLMIGFRLIKDIRDNFRVVAIAMQMCEQSQLLRYRTHSKESAIIWPAASAVSANWCRIAISPVWMQSKEN